MNYTDKVKEFNEKKLCVNQKLIEQGVLILDPNNTYIDEDVVIGKDTTIYPNVFILKASKIGSNVTILPNSYLSNAVIKDGTTIDSSKIVDSEVGENSVVGPMSHLRNHTCIKGEARIGNFVEFKNTNFDLGSKCAHLTYVGDSDVGKKVNFGCGVVTVNYDGKNKFRTTIKDGAFIGSNVNLIAPVTIGENALLAAGSTINKDIEDGDMGIARPRVEVKTGYGTKYKKK
ncbi:MAG: hypothetical protein EOM50_02290 [Erysipelotrichia bacterium]|nr:hypothetical protein [Erysipelotrichia bacterium]NCC54146.1 hypothetical protein [Erysipelotrichia bacterium]